MTKQIHESARFAVDGASKDIRVCLIEEGIGSSGEYPRSFFTQANADALAGALSFPAHPEDIYAPHTRNPLSAIGTIGENVVIEEHNGKLGLWSTYNPASSKPEVGPYIREFGHKLGLSVYASSEGYEDPITGRFIHEKIDATDPYRSVDLVVAPGARGRFEKISESLGLLPPKTSATAEEKEEPMEITKEDVEKIVAAGIAPVAKIVEGLVENLEGKAKASAQVEADNAAVEKIVESRFAEYDKAVSLISEAKLTESQSASLRELARSGEDITPHIESAKKILAEALALGDGSDDEGKNTNRIVENHLGGGSQKAVTFGVAGFGKVS